jgi:hypothetical protein
LVSARIACICRSTPLGDQPRSNVSPPRASASSRGTGKAGDPIKVDIRADASA